jgi:hypothetical protein
VPRSCGTKSKGKEFVKKMVKYEKKPRIAMVEKLGYNINKEK